MGSAYDKNNGSRGQPNTWDNPYLKPSPAAAEKKKSTRPEIAAFKSTLNADGTLNKNYAVQGTYEAKAEKIATPAAVVAQGLDTQALTADARAQNAMRERALSQGESPWLKMQLQKQRVEETTAADRAANQAVSGAAMARSQMAMKGGLGSGASQRLAMASARDMNAARQAVGRQGMGDRLGLGIADDQAKTQLLGQTAGLDLARAGQAQDMGRFNAGMQFDASKYNTGLAYDAAKTNVANRLDASKFNKAQQLDVNKINASLATAGLGGENAYNMQKYGEDMKGYSAEKAGAAIKGGGGGKK